MSNLKRIAGTVFGSALMITSGAMGWGRHGALAGAVGAGLILAYRAGQIISKRTVDQMESTIEDLAVTLLALEEQNESNEAILSDREKLVETLSAEITSLKEAIAARAGMNPETMVAQTF